MTSRLPHVPRKSFHEQPVPPIESPRIRLVPPRYAGFAAACASKFRASGAPCRSRHLYRQQPRRRPQPRRRRRHAAFGHPGGRQHGPGSNTIDLDIAGNYRITLPARRADRQRRRRVRHHRPAAGNSDHPEHQRRHGHGRWQPPRPRLRHQPRNTDNPPPSSRSPSRASPSRTASPRARQPRRPRRQRRRHPRPGQRQPDARQHDLTNNSATADGGGISMENLVSTPGR